MRKREDRILTRRSKPSGRTGRDLGSVRLEEEPAAGPEERQLSLPDAVVEREQDGREQRPGAAVRCEQE